MKKIMLSFSILFGLVVLNWWQVKQSESKQEKQEQSLKVLNFDISEAVKIKITNTKGHFVLEKVKANVYAFAGISADLLWQVKNENYTFLANQTQVANLLSELKKATKEKNIAQGEASFLDYGLNQGKCSIEVVSQSGKKTSLICGDLNSSGKSVYLADTASKNIFLSLVELKNIKEKKAAEYIHPNIVISKKDVVGLQSLTLKNKTGIVELQKEGAVWKLKKPIEILADQLSVNDFIQSLQEYKVDTIGKKYEDLKKQLQSYALANPEFHLKYKNVSGDATGIMFGTKNNDSEDHVYVFREDLPYVFAAKNKLPPGFYSTHKDWVIKDIFSFEASEVRAIRIEYSGKNVTLKEKEQAWYPVDKINDKEAINFGPAYDVMALKGNEFIRQGRDSGAILFSVALENKDKSKVEQLDVYVETFEKGNLELTKVYSQAYDMMLTIDQDMLNNIEKSIQQIIK